MVSFIGERSTSEILNERIMVRKTLASSDGAAKTAVVKRGSKSAKSVEKKDAPLSSSTRNSISASKPRGARVAKGVLAKTRKNAKSADNKTVSIDNSPSDIIYLGHIPAGFGEREMHKFFMQFGDVKKVKLFRNKKSLASRGHAFVKFENANTASTVADTINGYFLGERQLVSHVVPKNKLHSGMFKTPAAVSKTISTDGAASRKRKADTEDNESGDEEDIEPEGEEQKKKSLAKSAANLKKKQKKLAALGIEYDFLDALTSSEKKSTKAKTSTPAKGDAPKSKSAKKTPSKKSK